MQASVHRVDPATGDGSVITDEGVVLPFTAAVVAAGGLRHLRPGQRVTIAVQGSGPATRVAAIGITGVGRPPGAPSTP